MLAAYQVSRISEAQKSKRSLNSVAVVFSNANNIDVLFVVTVGNGPDTKQKLVCVQRTDRRTYWHSAPEPLDMRLGAVAAVYASPVTGDLATVLGVDYTLPAGDHSQLFVLHHQKNTIRFSRRVLRWTLSGDGFFFDANLRSSVNLDRLLPFSPLEVRPDHTWIVTPWQGQMLVVLPAFSHLSLLFIDRENLNIIAVKQADIPEAVTAQYRFLIEVERSPRSFLALEDRHTLVLSLKGVLVQLRLDRAVPVVTGLSSKESYLTNSAFVALRGSVLQYRYSADAVTDSGFTGTYTVCPSSWKRKSMWSFPVPHGSDHYLTLISTRDLCATACLSDRTGLCGGFRFTGGECQVFYDCSKLTVAATQALCITTTLCARDENSYARTPHRGGLIVRAPRAMHVHAFVRNAKPSTPGAPARSGIWFHYECDAEETTHKYGDPFTQAQFDAFKAVRDDNAVTDDHRIKCRSGPGDDVFVAGPLVRPRNEVDLGAFARAGVAVQGGRSLAYYDDSTSTPEALLLVFKVPVAVVETRPMVLRLVFHLACPSSETMQIYDNIHPTDVAESTWRVAADRHDVTAACTPGDNPAHGASIVVEYDFRRLTLTVTHRARTDAVSEYEETQLHYTDIPPPSGNFPPEHPSHVQIHVVAPPSAALTQALLTPATLMHGDRTPPRCRRSHRSSRLVRALDFPPASQSC